MHYLKQIIPLLLGASLCRAQFPTTPSGLTVVKSSVDEDVTISFKETKICEQPSGSKAYSGFVHLPRSVLSDIGGYDINTYFLYYEARNNPSTAPLGIYLAGGPGESSTYTALAGESGPCWVNIDASDTVNNPWSFNENVNMLYIDQPVQTGFSYDELVNATFDILSTLITPLDSTDTLPTAVNASFGYGKFPSQKFKQTTKTTVQSATALWHFAEHWLSAFPGYQTSSKKIAVWGNSYGGLWVPETAAQISKNLKSLSPKHPLKSKCLVVDAVGVTNGCVDTATGVYGWPLFAYNNTYGVHYSSEKEYENAVKNIDKPDGFQDLLQQCRELGELGDPDFSGTNATVNTACMTAFGFLYETLIQDSKKIQKRNAFDIAQTSANPCPYYIPTAQYLNTGAVQQDLGVPLNFTYDSNIVTVRFGFPVTGVKLSTSKETGDLIRQDGLSNIEYFLANDIKVAFVFGDRDYRCPWTGGEATALAAKWEGKAGFANAGYEELRGSAQADGDNGAVVKQYGQFSFSRVFDAGHSVSLYSPETVYRIFERTMLGLDVVTGKKKVDAEYQTNGPKTSWGWRNTLPKTAPETCIINGKFQETNPWTPLLSG